MAPPRFAVLLAAVCATCLGFAQEAPPLEAPVVDAYYEAVRAYEEARFPTSIQLLEQVVEQGLPHPRLQVRALQYLALAYRGEGLEDQFYETIPKVLDLDPHAYFFEGAPSRAEAVLDVVRRQREAPGPLEGTPQPKVAVLSFRLGGGLSPNVTPENAAEVLREALRFQLRHSPRFELVTTPTTEQLAARLESEGTRELRLSAEDVAALRAEGLADALLLTGEVQRMHLFGAANTIGAPLAEMAEAVVHVCMASEKKATLVRLRCRGYSGQRVVDEPADRPRLLGAPALRALAENAVAALPGLIIAEEAPGVGAAVGRRRVLANVGQMNGIQPGIKVLFFAFGRRVGKGTVDEALPRTSYIAYDPSRVRGLVPGLLVTFAEEDMPTPVKMPGRKRPMTLLLAGGAAALGGGLALGLGGGEAAPDTRPPVISDLSVADRTHDSVVITWNTDEPSSSEIYLTLLGPGVREPRQVPDWTDANRLTAHQATIGGLAPFCTYRFQIVAEDAAHNTSTYPSASPAPPGEPDEFLTLCDPDTPPILSDPLLNPDPGTTDDNFLYTVTYCDLNCSGDSTTQAIPGGVVRLFVDGVLRDQQATPDIAFGGWDQPPAPVQLLPFQVIHSGGMHFYHYEATDSDGNFTRLPPAGELAGPVVTVGGDPLPRLDYGTVSPDVGPAGQTFEYTVIYSDDLQREPSVVVAVIDGANYAMSTTQTNPGDLPTGWLYGLLKSDLTTGTHSYHFEATTVAGGVPIKLRYPLSGELQGPGVGTGWNTPPFLYDGAVEPAAGGPDQDYRYSVTYRDAENVYDQLVLVVDDGPPQYMQVAPGQPFPPNYTAGVEFEVSLSGSVLGNGTHRFRFEASDGIDTARLPASGDLQGPTITSAELGYPQITEIGLPAPGDITVIPPPPSNPWPVPVDQVGAVVGWKVITRTADLPIQSSLLRWGTVPTPAALTNVVPGVEQGQVVVSDRTEITYQAELNPLPEDQIIYYQIEASDNVQVAPGVYRTTFSNIHSFSTDLGPPVISNVAVPIDRISGTSVVVVWDTDEPATSEVRYWPQGPEPPSPDSVASLSFVSSHEVTVTGLDPGAWYSFEVLSADPAGNLAEAPGPDFRAGPYLASMSPASREAAVGEPVALFGQGFSSVAPGGTQVLFAGAAPVAPKPASDDATVYVDVPVGAQTGPLRVEVDGVSSNPLSFTVMPKVTGMSPVFGAVEHTVVVINGTNFGDVIGKVTFGGGVEAAAGDYVTNDPLTGDPILVNPTTGLRTDNTDPQGQPVTDAWTDQRIVVAVPHYALTGNVRVTTALGSEAKNPQLFTVIPHISKITVDLRDGVTPPTEFPVTHNDLDGNGIIEPADGEFVVTGVPAAQTETTRDPAAGVEPPLITIEGTSFTPDYSTDRDAVLLGGVPSGLPSWSDELIDVEVPPEALDGNLYVQANNNLSDNNVPFDVLPDIANINPRWDAVIGSAVEITGSGFGTTAGEVSFPGLDALNNPIRVWASGGDIMEWLPTRISVVVPDETKRIEPAGDPNNCLTVRTTDVPPFDPNDETAGPPSPDPDADWQLLEIRPRISTISPKQAFPGDEITITGADFGFQSALVLFPKADGSRIPVDVQVAGGSWSDTAITVPVPTGAEVVSGLLIVQNWEGKQSLITTPATPITSDARFLGIRPRIDDVVNVTGGSENVGTNDAFASESVEIQGEGFRPNADMNGDLAYSEVKLGAQTIAGDSASILGWTDTVITLSVPAYTAGTKTVQVVVETVDTSPWPSYAEESNTDKELDLRPYINAGGITPSPTFIGEAITIAGQSFGDAQGPGQVTFTDPNGGGGGGGAIGDAAWNPSDISLNVPGNLTTAGSVDVVVQVGGLDSNTEAFTLRPDVTSLSGASDGFVNDALTITGTALRSATGLNSRVVMGGAPAFDVSATLNGQTINTNVPSVVTANTSNVVVTTNDGAQQSDPARGTTQYTIKPNLLSITNGGFDGLDDGFVDDFITLNGTAFGVGGATLNVTFGTAMPAQGPVGVAATVVGGSGGTQASMKVPDDGTFLVPAEASLTGTVAGAGPGGSDATSDALSFTLHPHITGAAAPGDGGITVGSLVDISGASFGDDAGDLDLVTFGGVTATNVTWNSSLSIQAEVPSGGGSPVQVTVNGLTSNQFSFVIAPRITGINPKYCFPGDEITVTGSDFGTDPGKVLFPQGGGQYVATANTWTDTQITVNVPTGQGVCSGLLVIRDSSGQESSTASPATPITVDDRFLGVRPRIDSVVNVEGGSPNNGSSNAFVGETVEIRGEAFRSTDDIDSVGNTSELRINGQVMAPTSWSETTIAFDVPTTLPAGNLTVEVVLENAPPRSTGESSNTDKTLDLRPYISGIAPDPTFIGETITISGDAFGDTQGGSDTTFTDPNGGGGSGGAIGDAEWNDTSISLDVPANLTTAGSVKVEVQVAGLLSNTQTFTLQPDVADLSVHSGFAGDSFNISGTALRSASGLDSRVVMGGEPAFVVTAAANGQSITGATVPQPVTSKTSDLVVTTNDGAQQSDPGRGNPTFTIRPYLSSVGGGGHGGANEGYEGDTVTVTGTCFGSDISKVTLRLLTSTENREPYASSANPSGTQITVVVPNFDTPDQAILRVGVDGGGAGGGWAYSNEDKTFTIHPKITDVQPVPPATEIVEGATVDITGTSFGANDTYLSSVTFGGVAAAGPTWVSPTAIQAVMPAGGGSPLRLTVNGHDSNDYPIGVTPKITSLSPTQANVGDSIDINGFNLGTQATATVTIGGQAATVTGDDGAETQLTVTVPSTLISAGIKTVVVTVAAQASIADPVGADQFTLLPEITDFDNRTAGWTYDQRHAHVGQTVRVIGTALGLAADTVSLEVADDGQLGTGTAGRDFTPAITAYSGNGTYLECTVPGFYAGGAKDTKVTVNAQTDTNWAADTPHFTVKPYISGFKAADGSDLTEYEAGVPQAYISEDVRILGTALGEQPDAPSAYWRHGATDYEAVPFAWSGDGTWIAAKVPTSLPLAGKKPVKVVCPGGAGGIESNLFEYFAALPYITSLAPNNPFPSQSTNTLTVNGYGFETGVDYVAVTCYRAYTNAGTQTLTGGELASVSSTQIVTKNQNWVRQQLRRIRTGDVDVTITVGADDFVSNLEVIDVSDAPTIFSVTASSDPISEGTVLTLTGDELDIPGSGWKLLFEHPTWPDDFKFEITGDVVTGVPVVLEQSTDGTLMRVVVANEDTGGTHVRFDVTGRRDSNRAQLPTYPPNTTAKDRTAQLFPPPPALGSAAATAQTEAQVQFDEAMDPNTFGTTPGELADRWKIEELDGPGGTPTGVTLTIAGAALDDPAPAGGADSHPYRVILTLDAATPHVQNTWYRLSISGSADVKGVDGRTVTTSTEYNTGTTGITRPAITSITGTTSGLGLAFTNEEITIDGTNFGVSAGKVILPTLTGTYDVTTFTSWTDTQIVLDVPTGQEVCSGPVAVEDSVGTQSWTTDLGIRPRITDVVNVEPGSPNSGNVAFVGEAIEIQGEGFRDSADKNGDTTYSQIKFGADSFDGDTATTWTDTKITLDVPSIASAGSLAVEIVLEDAPPESTGESSNTDKTLDLRPSIDAGGITPASVYIGDNVTIAGQAFGDSQGTSTVTFTDPHGSGPGGGPVADPDWNPTDITVAVPSGLTTAGSVDVGVQVGGQDSNAESFTLQPQVTDFSKAGGGIIGEGDTVDITGSAFGGDNTYLDSVTFNGIEATTKTWISDTALQAEVPAGGAGPPIDVVVTVNGVASNTFTKSTALATEAEDEAVETEWRVQLIAAGGGLADADNFLGVVPAGQPAVTKPEVLARRSPFLSLYFIEMGAPAADVPLSAHYQQPSADALTWRLEAATDLPNTGVTLSWPDLSGLPRGVTGFLTDLDADRTVAMRSRAAYRYNTGMLPAPRHFEVRVGQALEGVLEITGLSVAPTRGGGATIAFSLTRPAEVEVEVRNIAGRLLRRIPAGLVASDTPTTVEWNGRSHMGSLAPVGHYLVHVRARSEDGQAANALGRAMLGR